MLSILIANSKGGSGKSTLATNLAGAFAQAGHQVLLADADRQGSALAWAERRPPSARPIAVANWTKAPGEVPRGIDRLVIDAAAGLKKGGVEELIAQADLVIMPVLPSAFDQVASLAFLAKLDELKAIRKNRKGIAVVGNRMRERTLAAQRLDRFLAGLGHAVVARLRDSQAYGEAAAAGLSIFELKAARNAALREDWQPLLDYVEHGLL
jgi:chromosome partitioning protein